MKKIIALFLCLALLTAFAGCSGRVSPDDLHGSITQNGNASDVTDSDANASDDTAEDEVPEFTIGTNTGTKWENSYLGLGLTLDDSYYFYDDEEVEELNRNTLASLGESLGDDYVESIKDLDFFYDMYATTEDASSTVNVMIENHTAAELINFSATKTIEQAMPSMKTSYEGMGYTNVQVNSATVTLAGKEYAAAKLTADFETITVYAYSVMGRVGNHLFTVSMLSTDEAGLQDLVDSFYKVQ